MAGLAPRVPQGIPWKDFRSIERGAGLAPSMNWRRHPDSNRGIRVLQPLALPLGYAAIRLNASRIEPARAGHLLASTVPRLPFRGARNYGKTKSGAFMCERDTAAAGFRAAKNEKRP